MSTVGIVATGAYVPRLRLQRSAIVDAVAWYDASLAALGKGERSMANWDEDAITMAVEAGRDALVGRNRETVSRVVLASTSLPFADRQNAGVVKEALNLDDRVGAMDLTGSQRAGTAALIACLEATTANGDPVLCLAADRRRASPASSDELIHGDGAAAFVVGQGDTLADFVGAHSETSDFIDHYRTAVGDHDYNWEGRWVRDEGYLNILSGGIVRGLARFDVAAGKLDHLIVALPDAKAGQLVARAAGVAPDRVSDSLYDRLGYVGAAHPLLMLSNVLASARPGAMIAVAAFGQGMDLLLFRATDRAGRSTGALGVEGWLARRRAETNYLKFLHFSGEVKLQTSMRGELDLKASHAQLYRDRKTIFGLVGGKCRVTGIVQYPKTRVSVAPNARVVDTQDDYPLADLRAHVVSSTADRLAFSPDPPARYGMIEFEGGGRFIADMTDLDEDPPVGAPMRMMFRVKRIDPRGFTQYFWKAVPDFRS